jgi:CheY-like chemotaxis protein
MTLHELTTNAARHGALSVAGGSVFVSWRRDAPPAGGALRMSWVERNGPPVSTAPRRKGFGQRVIDATVQDQLGGSVSFVWDPTGLRCELVIRVAHRVVDAAPPVPPAPPAGSDGGGPPAPSLAGCRVLVVEDEPLVAMDLAAALAALGCEVVGPVATLDEALRVSEAETAAGRLSAAVLDVNLQGVMSFPLADFLAERRVPFVYATGYGELSEVGGDAAPCVLRKPVAPAELADALHRAIAAARRGGSKCSAPEHSSP